MPILHSIQRRSPGGRLLLGGMYGLLVLGSLWMVYPLALMLSGSLKSGADARQRDLIPRYLYDDASLFGKYLEHRYAPTLELFEAATRYHDEKGRPAIAFESLAPPVPATGAVLDDYGEFLGQASLWPECFMGLGHNPPYHSAGELVLKYRRYIRDALPGIPPMERLTHPPMENWVSRQYLHITGPFRPVYEEFRKGLPRRYFIPCSVEGDFVTIFLRGRYPSVEALNAAWETSYASFGDVSLSATPPEHPTQRKDWWDYVREMLSTRFIRFSPRLLPAFQGFLKAKYGEISAWNKVSGTDCGAWNQLTFPSPERQETCTEMQGFLESLPSPEGVFMDSIDFRWRDFLRTKYHGDLAALDKAHGVAHGSFDAVRMPVLAYDWKILQAHRGEIIWEYLTRNYRVVIHLLVTQGHAFQNTMLFCALSVLTALIVNPLAAYGLSRFQPRWGYAILFILMATMTFPVEVTQIPSFLMLRELGWLNTFAALVLPTAANGYFIFLLKGFFDGLPRDLYESATLDGAGELRILMSIAIPFATPILAVTALGAFASAYGSFQFALLVCQKESMWTLMVHIYQLQGMYGQPILFAALVLAGIPTLLVFVFCQNLILRGLIVPVEK